MKARVKETGEIIDVSEKRNSGGLKYYICNNGFKSYDPSELDFEFKEIDWEQRRYEIATKVLSGLVSTTLIGYSENEEAVDNLVKVCLKYTDKLIEKLKSN